MEAINSCTLRVRALLDVFVHPTSLTKLQLELNSELVTPNPNTPFDGTAQLVL